MLSMVIKDLLLHKCPLLSRIAWNRSLRYYVVCCHTNDYPAAREYPSLENK